jgi:hypothetical protein
VADPKRRQIITAQTGGRNGYAPPWEVQDTECVDAVNVDLYGTPFARKRGGLVNPNFTGAGGASRCSTLYRHVPATDPTVAELWATDNSAGIFRLAGGPAWVTPTVQDPPTGQGWNVTYASINGKLMIAYQSAQPRLHLWDGTTVRRAGIRAALQPLVADQGVGQTISYEVGSARVLTSVGPTFTFTITSTATNPVVFVAVSDGNVGGTTGVTANGTAMALVGSTLNLPGTRRVHLSLYMLAGGSPGNKTIVVTTSGANAIDVAAATYAGAAVAAVDSTGSTVNGTAGSFYTSVTAGTTTVAPGAMTVGVFYIDDPSAGAFANHVPGTTPRQDANIGLMWGDSNTQQTPPGFVSLGARWVVGGSPCTAAIVASFAPSGTGYPSVQRFYRVRWTRQTSGLTLGRSEPGPMTVFTPSGSAIAARVSQPSQPGESETHWEVEASIDGVSFYRIATVAKGTTVYDDTNATTTYANFPLSALTGTYSLLPAAKFIAADQGRLLTFGSWTPTDKQNDIIVSAVIGATDISDEERMDTTTNYRIGLDENDSGVATGILGPVNGAYLAFKDRQTWLLTPSGLTTQPYYVSALTKTVGAVGHAAMDRGEDANGNACAYWMSHKGAYRWGLTGLEYIGRNMEDYVLPGGNSVTQINLNPASNVAVVRYFPDKRQVWYWWATTGSDGPNMLAIYDVMHEAWTRVPSTDTLANVRCACLFSNTVGAAMSLDLKPYVAPWNLAMGLIVKKADSGYDDDGVPFRAYVITKAVEPGGQGTFGECGDAELLAKTANGVTLQKTTIADFGTQTHSSSASLGATGAQTRVHVQFLDTGISNVRFVQHQIGDSVAVANTWTLERLITPMGPHGTTTK